MRGGGGGGDLRLNKMILLPPLICFFLFIPHNIQLLQYQTSLSPLCGDGPGPSNYGRLGRNASSRGTNFDLIAYEPAVFVTGTWAPDRL